MRHIFGQSNKTGLAGWRLWFLVAAFGAVCMGFVARLLYLQVVDTEEYESKAVANNYKSAVIPASRGEIYDRNGKKLVTNVISYNIDINRTTLENGGSVEILSKLIDLLAKHDVEIPDTCPLTLTAPYALDGDYIFDADKKRLFERFLKNNDKDASELTGTDFYAYLVKRFGIDEDLAQTPKGRKIAAIRYDMENADFSTLTPYTLLRNVDETLKTVISEHSYELHGIEISRRMPENTMRMRFFAIFSAAPARSMPKKPMNTSKKRTIRIMPPSARTESKRPLRIICGRSTERLCVRSTARTT